MKISTIIRWQMFCTLQLLIQSEKCFSTYFKVLHGSKFTGPPLERIAVESGIVCAVRCGNKEWCKAFNFIDNGEPQQYCELFNKRHVGLEQVIKDESSEYYYYLKINDSTNETQRVISVSSSAAHASATAQPTDVSSSTFSTLSASSAFPLQVTSFSASILPSSVASSAMTSSVMQPTGPNIPAVACQKIFQDNSNSPDGAYTIFPGTVKEAFVYCDMTGASTGCGGGGWTLVMRISGQQQTFHYGSNSWENKQHYQEYYAQWLTNSHETKATTYHTTPFTQICLGMEYNNEKRWTILNLTSTSLYDLISSNQHHATDLAVSKWTGLIPAHNTALQPNCRIQGINAVRGGTGVRIGIIATKTCGVDGDYNSRIGFGAKGTSCGQDGTNTCGNDARCSGVASIKTKGYILVK